MSARSVLAIAIVLTAGLGHPSAAPAGESDGGAKQTRATLWKPRAIAVSQQTTYIEGPLDKDGRIDW